MAMTLMTVELWRGGGGNDETCGGDGVEVGTGVAIASTLWVGDSHCSRGYGCGGWCVIFFFLFLFLFQSLIAHHLFW